MAVGAHNKLLPIPGAERENVVSAWEVLRGSRALSGHCLVVGGGLVGTETAEYLLSRGCRVSRMKRSDRIAGGVSPTVRPRVLADFEAGHVTHYLHTRITAVTEEIVRGVDLQTGEKVPVPCDWVVMAVGAEKNDFSADGVRVPLYFVGDCAGDKPADIASAIRSAYHAANAI
ncbi:MAG: FAD-dependent oxidoreductase [Oscillospiraceae bacterium]